MYHKKPNAIWVPKYYPAIWKVQLVFTGAHANRSNGYVFGIRLILIQIFFSKAEYFIYRGAKEWGIKKS
jgi:hypothetical protein